jgi:hypothetical protein
VCTAFVVDSPRRLGDSARQLGQFAQREIKRSIACGIKRKYRGVARKLLPMKCAGPTDLDAKLRFTMNVGSSREAVFLRLAASAPTFGARRGMLCLGEVSGVRP